MTPLCSVNRRSKPDRLHTETDKDTDTDTDTNKNTDTDIDTYSDTDTDTDSLHYSNYKHQDFNIVKQVHYLN